MKYTHVRSCSVALLVAGLAFSVTGGAFAQNDSASPIAHKKANENAAEAGAESGTDVQAAAGVQASGADDVGGPDGHSCGGLGHVISQGVGHEDDQCSELGIDASVTGSVTSSTGSTNSIASPDCSISGLEPLLALFTEEHAAAIRQADQAAIAELEGCVEVAGNTEVQSAVADNDALMAALEARGYAVSQVVAADARTEVPTLYVAVPDVD